MSDAILLAFGCAVSFIVLAGVYVYLREGYVAWEQPPELKERGTRVADEEGREAA